MKARFEYRIAPGGRHAVCLTGDATSGLYLETWERSAVHGWRPGQLLTPVHHPQMLPMDDGRVLLYDSISPPAWASPHAPPPPGGDADPAIWLLSPDGRQDRLTTGELTNLRLIAAPRSDRTGLAIRYGEGGSEIWRLVAERPGLVGPLVKVPGLLLSGLRLDPAGTQLAIERADVPSGPTDVVLVDLNDGDWSTLLNVTPDSHDTILLADPRRQLVVVGTDATGVRRIGWTRLGESEPLRFPTALNPDGEPVEPLAVSPSGQELLLHRVQGVRSTMLVHRLGGDDHLTELPLPPAHVHSPAKWTADGLTLVLSTPTSPARPVAISPTPVDEIAPPGQVSIETLAGADGTIEALVYGGPNWRDSERLLIALRGGPLSAWRYEFDPLLHQLAAAGVAIVAPNQRGSTGYGSRHALAIQDNWGGPDLDDILRIATDLQAYRSRNGLGRLLLYGHSYGAFLALLAAAAAPLLWSKCATLAPFLSGESLYPQAGPGVRTLLDRLGGRAGPRRDVLSGCHHIEADLLIAHGARDPMVPVDQSRTLRQHLLQHGRREGHDLHYLEPADGTHELMTDPAGPVVKAVVAFLAGHGPVRENLKGGEITWVRPATFA
jgi:pimeloyl-ACP methyl ester carboxylesterase